MSLNVFHGYPEYKGLPLRLNMIAEEIRRQKADIVALQEVPWTRELDNGARNLADAVGMNYLYLRANGNRRLIGFEEGVVILSRFELVNPSFVELEPRAGFFEHRVALGVTTKTPMGDIDIVVTHLTNGEPERNRLQAEGLLEFVERSRRRPMIVAGDFNAMDNSPQIIGFSGTWIDVFRSIHPSDPGLTCCVDNLNASQSNALDKRIDYVFLSDDPEESVQIRDARLTLNKPFRTSDGWQWASDHFGLLVTIEMVD